MSLIVLLIFLIPLGLSSALIFHGIRGYRVGDHPVCRRCGYDLFGLPAGTAVCGECGGSLLLPKNVVIGQRKRRISLIAAGSVLLIPFLFVAGVFAWGHARQMNWWARAPLWYVLREASSSDASWRRLAIGELKARFAGGDFSALDLNRVLDAGLAYQGDIHRAWDCRWGDLIEDAIDAGKVTADRIERYAKQSVGEPIRFRVDSKVRAGEAVQWHVDIPATRLANRSSFKSSYEWNADFPDDPLGPKEWGPSGGGGCGFFPWNLRHYIPEGPQHVDYSTAPTRQLQLGMHRIVIHWNRSTSGPDRAKLKANIDTSQELSAKFEVLAGAATERAN